MKFLREYAGCDDAVEYPILTFFPTIALLMSDFISHIIGNIASPDRMNAAIIAMLLVALFGMLFGASGGNANPFLWACLDKIFGGLTRRTYKVDRSEESLQFRGAVLLTLYLLITGIIAALALLIERKFHLVGFMDPILLTACLSGGATWASLVRLHHAVRAEENKKNKDIPKGSFYDIAVSTRSNLNTTDNHGILRVGIGFVATNFDKGIVVPLFWYVLGGLPAAFLYSGIAAARWSLSKEGFAKGIGTLALNLEKAVAIVPQVLSAFLLSLAALLTPKASFLRSLYGMFTVKGLAPYAEGGISLTSLAYGLGVSLGGPVEDIDGSVLKRAWVGAEGSSARVDRHHLRMAIYLSIMAFAVLFAFVLAGAVAGRF